jgi:predicted nucleic acid-binding protein
MGLKYLWDTNAVVYYLQNNFSETGQGLMNNIINTYQPAMSAITEIELLCWKTIATNDKIVLIDFISDSVVFELEHEIKLKTVEIRKNYNIKLPDSIIAATAIVMDLTLISNDKKGFTKISSLKLLNPALINSDKH